MERLIGGPQGPQRLVQAVVAEGREPGTKEDPFPKVVGRTRRMFNISTSDGIASVENPTGHSILDKVNVRSATAMSGGE